MDCRTFMEYDTKNKPERDIWDNNLNFDKDINFQTAFDKIL